MNEERFGSAVRVLSLENGVAELWLAQQGGTNKLGEALLTALEQAVAALAGRPGLRGVVLRSEHRDFCVGADLELIYSERDPAVVLALSRRLGASLRRLETAGVPVACVIAGAALGGGYELALACHYRVAVDDRRTSIGLPEVSLGVIPGGGGTQRAVRLLGFQGAFELVLQGQVLRAGPALAKGLVHALAPSVEEAAALAVGFCLENPTAKQPWDAGKRMPGPQPGSGAARDLCLGAQAMLYAKTAGAFPAPEAALAVMQEGALLDFERGLEVEGRAFAKLVVSDQAKDMIRTLFFHKLAAEKHVDLPVVAESGVKRVAVLGAGMMGAGLAFLFAKAGYEVVLKDVTEAALQRGLAHVDKQVARQLKHQSEAAREAVRGRLKGVLELDAMGEVDLVVEAVFEDLALKHRVIRETEPKLSANGIFASNSSALPMAELGQASAAPERFLGMHFFSPVERMALIEIVRGPETSDETVGRALQIARSIGKLPIVVNDGYGFYTTRVFSAYILEGAQLVAEGVDPRLVEWAARSAGMVVPPLQVFDEVSLSLGKHALLEARSYDRVSDGLAGVALIERMVDELGRLGRAQGGGFYDYVDGERTGVWSGLSALCAEPVSMSLEQVKERLMLAQLAEVGRSIDDGVLRTWRDAEVGAVFGVGFAPNTGGPLAMIDRIGVSELARRLDRLIEQAGTRYRAAGVFRRMAESGQRFFPL